MLKTYNRPPVRSKRPSQPRKRQASGRVLTVRQIKSRYPSQWILLKDPILDRNLQVLKGEVAGHGKDRDEIDRKAIELRLKQSAFLFTGEMPKDAVIVL